MRRCFVMWTIGLLLCTLCLSPLSAAELFVGTAKTSITPDEPVALTGQAHARVSREVETPWGTVQVKEKWLGGERLAASPEYEDCARLARASGEPLARIMAVARQIAEQPG